MMPKMNERMNGCFGMFTIIDLKRITFNFKTYHFIMSIFGINFGKQPAPVRSARAKRAR
jgi:Mg2+ and Co2+ transporter CorA